MTSCWEDVEKKVNQVIRLLDDLIPEKTYLHLPLVSAVVFWGLKRRLDWKEKIFEKKIWPAPPVIREKPDEFIRDFFRRRPALEREFRPELDEGNSERLRRIFNRLYPVFGLEDPFLNALFKEELEKKEYRRLIADYEARIHAAQRDIQILEKSPELRKALDALYQHALSLGSDVLTQRDVQKNIIKMIEDHVHKKRE